jgi:hypothetical protein
MHDTTKFLKALDPTAAAFEFRTFDDRGDDDSLTKPFYGSFEQHAAALHHLNAQGAGVFVTVNATDGKGRSAANIVRIRAVFVDLDGSPLQPVLDHHLKPHVVVASSPNKFHAYWLANNDIPLDQFSAIQDALAERFDGDNVKDLCRIMRLPGFMHRKADPHPVRIVTLNDMPRYSGNVFERMQYQPHVSHAQETVTDREILLAVATLYVIPPQMEWPARNRIGMAMWRATGGDQQGFDAWCWWLYRSGRYDERHAQRQWRKYGKYLPKPHRKPVGLGTLMFIADRVDPQWRNQLRDFLNGRAV